MLSAGSPMSPTSRRKKTVPPPNTKRCVLFMDRIQLLNCAARWQQRGEDDVYLRGSCERQRTGFHPLISYEEFNEDTSADGVGGAFDDDHYEDRSFLCESDDGRIGRVGIHPRDDQMVFSSDTSDASPLGDDTYFRSDVDGAVAFTSHSTPSPNTICTPSIDGPPSSTDISSKDERGSPQYLGSYISPCSTEVGLYGSTKISNIIPVDSDPATYEDDDNEGQNSTHGTKLNDSASTELDFPPVILQPRLVSQEDEIHVKGDSIMLSPYKSLLRRISSPNEDTIMDRGTLQGPVDLDAFMDQPDTTDEEEAAVASKGKTNTHDDDDYGSSGTDYDTSLPHPSKSSSGPVDLDDDVSVSNSPVTSDNTCGKESFNEMSSHHRSLPNGNAVPKTTEQMDRNWNHLVDCEYSSRSPTDVLASSPVDYEIPVNRTPPQTYVYTMAVHDNEASVHDADDDRTSHSSLPGSAYGVPPTNRPDSDDDSFEPVPSATHCTSSKLQELIGRFERLANGEDANRLHKLSRPPLVVSASPSARSKVSQSPKSAAPSFFWRSHPITPPSAITSTPSTAPTTSSTTESPPARPDAFYGDGVESPPVSTAFTASKPFFRMNPLESSLVDTSISTMDEEEDDYNNRLRHSSGGLVPVVMEDYHNTPGQPQFQQQHPLRGQTIRLDTTPRREVDLGDHRPPVPGRYFVPIHPLADRS